MGIPERLVDEMNKQLNRELRNAYLYLSMAAFYEEKGLPGFANYFLVQAREELEHAMKIYRFILDRGWRVVLQDIPAPKTEWSSVEEPVEDFLEAEKRNTESIWRLVDIAREEGDKAAEQFLQWFVEEQVEEEKQALELKARLGMVRGSPAALLALDNMLAKRGAGKS